MILKTKEPAVKDQSDDEVSRDHSQVSQSANHHFALINAPAIHPLPLELPQKPEQQASAKLSRSSSSKPARPGLYDRIKRIITLNLFSSLSRRIATLNLIALVVLLSGILYLNQFRDGLIDARVQSLMIQGRIIASAIAASASADANIITIDPEKFIQLQAGESTTNITKQAIGFDTPLSPERVAPLLRSLIRPTHTRARVYDDEGSMLLDSRHLYAGGPVQRYDLPPLNRNESGMTERIGKTLNRWLERNDLPIYRELVGNNEQYPEVKEALIGGPATVVRMTERGELIVSVAVPIQHFRGRSWRIVAVDPGQRH